MKAGDVVKVRETDYVGQVMEIDPHEGLVYVEVHELGVITVVPRDLEPTTVEHKHVFEQFQIREHHYCFQRCECGAYRGGDRVKNEVNRLLRIKVRPQVRRA